MRPQLVFWRNVPHDVDLGYVSYVAEHWGADITVVCEHESDGRIESLNFGDIDSSAVTTVVLKNQKNRKEKIREIIDTSKDAIHIFSGMRGVSKEFLDTYLELESKPKVVIYAEIPSVRGNLFERALRRYVLERIYKKLHNKYNDTIGCFITLGEKGKRVYETFGFDKDVIYPFMYCPRMPVVTNTHQTDDELKFLYVGRLDDRNKGLDILMKAIDKLSSSTTQNWSLDIVGGYGEIRHKVFDWAKRHKKVNCIGTVAFSQICEDMGKYDVCIVPSHYDGWNMTPNMAINAGCATIITNKATSDELIRGSNSGVVIEDDAQQLFSAMKTMCEDTSTVAKLKENTKSFTDKISGDIVGQYFIDILDYTFNLKDTDKPECPWL